MGMKVVVDTSALLTGKSLPADFNYFAPPSVMDEISRRVGEIFIDIHYVQPDTEFLDIVKNAAKKTGDLKKLSSTDLEVIALALQLNAPILTEDFSIQNVASYLGIKFFGDKEIKEERKWIFRCTGCGRYFNEFLEVCPYCGHEIKRTRKKRRKVY